jgi:hypothetical protein
LKYLFSRSQSTKPQEIHQVHHTNYSVQHYEYVASDAYHKIPRITLYKWDGAPMMPLYLAMSTPKMLPTTTLNPLVTQTPSAKNSKRGELPMNHEVLYKRTPGAARAEQWWWFGVFMTAGGSVLYYFF